MTLTALYPRHGKRECAVGAAAALTADIKVMVDEMRLGLVTAAPVTEGLPRPLKVTVVNHSRDKRRRSPDSTSRALERLWPCPSLDGCPYHAIWICVLG